jgi:hypothetical protein
MTKSARTDNAPVTVRYDGPPILHLHDPAGDRPGNRRSLFGLEPRPPDAVKLVASEFWRLRVAALRVVYAIDEPETRHRPSDRSTGGEHVSPRAVSPRRLGRLAGDRDDGTMMEPRTEAQPGHRCPGRARAQNT